MFESERDFKKAVAGLRIDTTPNLAHKERLRRQMLARFQAAGPAIGPGPLRSGIGTIIKLGVAAAIVVSAVIGVGLLHRQDVRPSMLAQVRAATHEMPWVHATVTEYRDEGDRTEEQWNDMVSKVTYIQTSGGFVFCSQYGDTPRQLVYDPRAKAVIAGKLPAKGFLGVKAAYTLVDAAEVLATKGRDCVKAWADFYECRAVQVYEIEQANPGFKFGDQPVGLLQIKLMADPETKRLVAARVEYQGDNRERLARQDWIVKYPQSGPKSIYDLGVPRSARIIKATARPTGTPEDRPRPISTPADAGRI